MLVISVVKVEDSGVAQAEVPMCLAIDYATIAAKDTGDGIVPLSQVRCEMSVNRVLILQLADDMFIPIPSCKLHFNAFRLSIADHVVNFGAALFED